MPGKFKNNSYLRNTTSLNEKFLDVAALPKLRANVYDEDYVIDLDVEERPDLLAFKVYGDANLWWVFAMRNPDELVDPIRDFKQGVTIKLPSAESVQNLVR
tara:strand:+ start:355 stop:657 length:303 start_codon:yes stop_codon:yes gene_type:complete